MASVLRPQRCWRRLLSNMSFLPQPETTPPRRSMHHSSSPSLSSLEQQLREKWTIRVEDIEIGEWKLDLWTVANPDDSLDALMSHPKRKDDLWEPYWAQSWASSIDCARAMLSRDLRGVDVLDLGCGLGTTGAAAANQGADVWMVDNADPALPFAERNTWPWRDRITIRRIDWTRDRLPRKYPLIVGADILYDDLQWQPLEHFWREHLSDDGELLLGEPNRAGCADFCDWLCGRGWDCTSTTSENGRLISSRLRTS